METVSQRVIAGNGLTASYARFKLGKMMENMGSIYESFWWEAETSNNFDFKCLSLIGSPENMCGGTGRKRRQIIVTLTLIVFKRWHSSCLWCL